jgi:hypothetical protein
MRSTRMPFVVLGVMMMLAAGVARSAFAHHSQSQFEPEITISIEGTLTKASWSNPHTSPRQLEAKGWGRAVSKLGDKVTFEGRPRRDGKPEVLLLRVTLADGRTISFKPE